MLAHLTLLLSCQLAGEVIARLFAIPVPGAVLGMMLLFLGLAIRGEVPANSAGRRTGCSGTCRCCSFRPASGSWRIWR